MGNQRSQHKIKSPSTKLRYRANRIRNQGNGLGISVDSAVKAGQKRIFRSVDRIRFAYSCSVSNRVGSAKIRSSPKYPL